MALWFAPGCIGSPPMTTSATGVTGEPTSDSTADTNSSGLSASSTSAGTLTTSSGGTSTTAATSTVGTSASASDSDASDSEPECAFIPCTDVPREPQSCDVYLQDCPEGMKCTHDHLEGWSFCVDVVPSPDDIGEPCEIFEETLSGIDSCDVGGLCWYFDEEQGLGECISFCQGSQENPSCEDETTHCSIGCQSCVGICLHDCDPLAVDCPNGGLCVSTGDNIFECVFDGDELGGYGDGCEFINSCEHGLACIPAKNFPECEFLGCCAPFCDLDDPTCPDGELGIACVPFFDDPKPSTEHIGICILP